jgi:O-methyltransferase
MKKTIIFGAGQGGHMALNLLSADHEITAFCDNKKSLQNTVLDNIPVLPPASANWKQAECAVIAVFNLDAVSQIRSQLQELGFCGSILVLTDLRKSYDARLAVLRLMSKEIHQRNIEGDVAELGVYKGATAAQLNRLFPERTLHLFDTFEGFFGADVTAENGRSHARSGDFSDTSADLVRSRLPYPEQTRFYIGRFPSLLPADETRFCLVSLDPDLYLPTATGLRWFYPRMNKGGVIVVHDYNNLQFSGVRDAVNEFCDEYGVVPVPLCDLHGSCIIQKN